MLQELNEAEEFPRSRIAQLTHENQNLKERLTVLTTESDERLKEFEECRRELEMKEKHIRRLWRKTNCSQENMELLEVEMSHKGKENTRLKEEIEEQKRSRLETERELKEEITELQEEQARLHQQCRKEIENIIEERDQYAMEFRTLQQETRERLLDPPDQLPANQERQQNQVQEPARAQRRTARMKKCKVRSWNPKQWCKGCIKKKKCIRYLDSD